MRTCVGGALTVPRPRGHGGGRNDGGTEAAGHASALTSGDGRGGGGQGRDVGHQNGSFELRLTANLTDEPSSVNPVSVK